MLYIFPVLLAAGGYLGWKADNALSSAVVPSVPTGSSSGFNLTNIAMMLAGGFIVLELMKHAKKVL